MNAKSAPPEETVEEREELAGPEVDETPLAETAASEDDQGIGARVTAVFTAAEKAGQHIVTLAREEADDIRREARVEADAYLQQQKVEADQEVERILAEARRKAEAIEADARLAARQVEDDARVRKERLREEARLIEDRIAWAKEGLVEVNERLQQVFLVDDSLPLAPEREPGS
jgi:F0F1-type ATP synthase membrane subunit b/b'